MNLRRNPKRKTTYDAGSIKSSTKYNKKRMRRIRYRKLVEKQAAIDANMVKLLTVAKSKDPAIHLYFWQENLRSDYPVVEIKKSNLTNGRLGLFVTDNCIFLPKELMYIPNCPQGPRKEPAESDSLLSMCQFAINHGGKLAYLFPSIDPNLRLSCAQFINSPLQRSQGHYSDNVNKKCRQAMHLSNVKLLGTQLGGFIGEHKIYPGFEILGECSKCHRLPEVEDYQTNRAVYMERWEIETEAASLRQESWLSEIKTKYDHEIDYWESASQSIHCELIQDQPITTIGDSEEE